jgi:hypothetical protein
MATDAPIGLTALINAVHHQQALIQVPERHGGNVLDNDLLEIGKGHFRQHPAPRLDLPGDGQAVPERLADTVLEQKCLLRHVRHPRTGEQRCICVEELSPPLSESRSPGCDGCPAPPGTGWHVVALGIEPAVHAHAIRDMRRGYGCFRVELFFTEGEFRHGPARRS